MVDDPLEARAGSGPHRLVNDRIARVKPGFKRRWALPSGLASVTATLYRWI